MKTLFVFLSVFLVLCSASVIAEGPSASPDSLTFSYPDETVKNVVLTNTDPSAWQVQLAFNGPGQSKFTTSLTSPVTVPGEDTLTVPITYEDCTPTETDTASLLVLSLDHTILDIVGLTGTCDEPETSTTTTTDAGAVPEFSTYGLVIAVLAILGVYFFVVKKKK